MYQRLGLADPLVFKRLRYLYRSLGRAKHFRGLSNGIPRTLRVAHRQSHAQWDKSLCAKTPAFTLFWLRHRLLLGHISFHPAFWERVLNVPDSVHLFHSWRLRPSRVRA